MQCTLVTFIRQVKHLDGFRGAVEYRSEIITEPILKWLKRKNNQRYATIILYCKSMDVEASELRDFDTWTEDHVLYIGTETPQHEMEAAVHKEKSLKEILEKVAR